VDIYLEDPGIGCEREVAIAALRVAGRPDAEMELVKFAIHRKEGGTKTWSQWMGLVPREEGNGWPETG
jgi:hypothetical protein